jgi:hypothetical protein
MIQNPIDQILGQMSLSKQEQEAFLEILKYAKACQKGTTDTNLRKYIDNKIETLL